MLKYKYKVHEFERAPIPRGVHYPAAYLWRNSVLCLPAATHGIGTLFIFVRNEVIHYYTVKL
jgi:hypothetical protein